MGLNSGKKFTIQTPEDNDKRMQMRTATENVFFAMVVLLLATGAVTYSSEELNATQEHILGSGKTRLFIENITDGQDITDHEMGIVTLRLIIETVKGPDGKPTRPPVEFDENTLTVEVNGNGVPYLFKTCGSGHDDKVSYFMRDTAVRLGSQSGRKTIRVAQDHLDAETTVNYQPEGQIAICGLFDGSAFFGMAATINWLGCYLYPETVKLRINGEIVASEVRVSKYGSELLEGKVKDNLDEGASLIEMQAVDVNGKMLETEVTVFCYPNMEIPVGDTFILRLGRVGSKSGPFFRAKVKGKSLALRKNRFCLRHDHGSVITSLREDGFAVEADFPVLAELRAVETGPAVIIVEKKTHFMDKAWLEDDTFNVIVVDKP